MTTFHTPWRPIFEKPPAQATVASDCRLSVVQQRDFLARASRMGAEDRERKEIAEALQLCERTYGFKRIECALHFVEGLLACATMSLAVSISHMAAFCELASSGVLAGALIEEWLGIEPASRRFPIGKTLAPPAGHSLAFGDCVMAARWMDALHCLASGHADRLRAYAHLVRAIRTQAGAVGLKRAAEMTRHAAPTDNPEQSFIRVLAEEVSSKHIDPGLIWDWYVRVSHRPLQPSTWALDVVSPMQEAR